MDQQTYASVTAVCGRLAGRLSDDTLGTVREHYAAGEWDLADGTLLLNLAYEGVGITDEERAMIRAFLGDPDTPDLHDVPAVADVPLLYTFTSTAPADAPDPSRPDIVLSTDAPRHGGRKLRRTWREPLAGARDGHSWVYLLQVDRGTDELKAYSGLSSRLWVALQVKVGLEVVVEGDLLPPYQAAALTAAPVIWTA